MAYVNQRTIQKIIDRKIEAFISEIEEKKSWDLKGLNLKVLDTSKNMKFIKKTIIDNFKIMINKVYTLNEKAAIFKAREYNDTIKALNEYDGDINCLEDVEKILINYGKKNPTKTLKKIDEIIRTGTLKEAEEAKQNPLIISVNNLTKIYGIGYKKAIDLYNKYKIVTINDLQIKFNMDKTIIHSKQQIGLNYFDDLNVLLMIQTRL